MFIIRMIAAILHVLLAVQDTRAHQLNVDDDTDSSESYSDLEEEEEEDEEEEEEEEGGEEDNDSSAVSVEAGKLVGDKVDCRMVV